MGAFNIKNDGELVHRTGRTALFTRLALAATLVWIGAVLPAAAEPTDDRVGSLVLDFERDPERGERIVSPEPNDAPVSTSPTPLRAAVAGPGTSLPATDSPAELVLGQEGVALTRAAAQRRVETMSPVGWLSAYGTVRIARPN